MDNWGKREYNTTKLIRFCAGYLIDKEINYMKLHALCKLTWITGKNYETENSAYIKSTKIPSLMEIFGIDRKQINLTEITNKIANITSRDLREIKSIVEPPTGFTNFYNAYRKSSEKWIKENFVSVLEIMKMGFYLNSDADGEVIINKIMTLRRIPRGGTNVEILPDLNSESLLTPLIFSLDERLRFPLLNGNDGIKGIISTLNLKNQSLLKQYKGVVKLIGQNGIQSAIDIDRLGSNIENFIPIGNRPPRNQIINHSSRELGNREESDIQLLQQSLNVTVRRIHNEMTNMMIKKLSNDFYLSEGNESHNMYDVLIHNLPDNDSDLLVEVKSSSEMVNLRMAVGQLYDYSRHLNKNRKIHKAIFVPELPDQSGIDYLKYCKVDIVWRNGDKIFSNNIEYPFIFKKV
jgi:hypothetical protein